MLICFWSKLLVEKNDGVDFDAYVPSVIKLQQFSRADNFALK